jgi:hypothetical protein
MNTNQKIKELIKDWQNQIDMNGNREYRQAYRNCIIALETLLEPECKHETVKNLLTQRESIEDKIRSIDKMALVNYELEKLGI